MRLSIDVDGVLRDFLYSLKFTYKKYHPTAKIHEITSFNLADFFPEKSNIKEFYKVHATEVMFRNAPLIVDADKGIRYLRRLGHTIIINTSQTEETIEPTIKWLKKFKFKYDEMYDTKDKHLVDFDLHIDDDPENLIKIVKAGKRGIIFSSSQNRRGSIDPIVDEKCKRVRSWAEIIDIFEDLANVESHIKNFISFRSE